MSFFVFFFLRTVVCVVSNDFVHLLSIEGLFGLDFHIKAVGLFLKLLYGDFLERYLAFEFLISCEEAFVPLDKLFLFNPKLREFILKACDLLGIIGFGFFQFVEQILIPSQVSLPSFFQFFELSLQSN